MPKSSRSTHSVANYNMRDLSGSRGAAPPTVASATTAPTSTQSSETTVNLNWAFFRKTELSNPSSVTLTQDQFANNIRSSRDLFANALNADLDVQLKSNKIMFWKPIEYVSIYDAAKDSWKNLTNFYERFENIPWAATFDDALSEDINDKRCLHIILTNGNPPKASGMDDTHEEARDEVGELLPQRRFNATLADKGPSPSEGSKSRSYAMVQTTPSQAIFDGRYYYNPNKDFCTIAPPVEIFHPVFDRFRHRFRTTTPSRDVLIKVQQFMKMASEIHPGELSYAAKLRSALSDILGIPLTQESNNDTTIADGVYSIDVGPFRLSILVMEVKREWGEGGSDASTQGGLSMRRVWRDNRTATIDIRSKCCCPTFILAGGGPWLGVLGGVFTDRVIVQRLTDMMWIGQSSTYEDSRAYRFAQMMVALRDSLLELKEYYTKLHADNLPGFRPDVPHPRFFPYPTSCKADGGIVSWKYVKALEEDSTCVTYLAEVEESSTPQRESPTPQQESPKLVVVKFVDRYGQKAHRFLAREGHAPKLWYCGPLQPSPATSQLPTQSSPAGIALGSMQMVVMDYVKPHSPADVEPPASMRNQLKAILTKMHKAGYVFGDLRKPNVILDKEGCVQLIDFDWAGRYDMSIEDKLLNTDPQGLIPEEVLEDMNSRQNPADNAGFAVYPLDLSKSVFKDTGADDLLEIRPAHDWRMLHMLKQLPDEPQAS